MGLRPQMSGGREDGRPSIDLEGPWQVFLQDPKTEGADKLPAEASFANTVSLPGSVQAQGLGSEVDLDTVWIGEINDRDWFDDERYAPYRKKGNIKVPYWLQPARRFIGVAWYRRAVTVPAGWNGRVVTLHLERPHWQTGLWLDGRYIGSNDSLSVAHEYELGDLTEGEHQITISVDNRMIHNIGPNSHSMADHTQGNWNGIAGKIRLAAAPAVRIASLHVTPSVRRRSALLRVEILNTLDAPVRGTIALRATGRVSGDGTSSPELEFSRGLSLAHVEYRLPADAPLWDEFDPATGRLETVLTGESGDGQSLEDRAFTTLALREVESRGTQLAVNGRPIFLRGSLECCVFPLTGYPPTDGQSWRRLYGQAKAHGLNHIRFHSWCPPEAAFAVADELGLYLQVECPTWANQGASVGTDPDFDAWLFREAERIVAAYGNHPSFIMMAYGNEPAGRTEEFLGAWVAYWKQRDGRRLYTTAAGWPVVDENDYHNTPLPRIQAWGEGLGSRINARPPETQTDYREMVERTPRPIVSHEIGQWCAFPNFDEIEKYSGFMKARNFEIFRDFLEDNGMGHQARALLLASGKLQTACYKEEIESALRTPGFAGFQLLGLSDFPGQGSALVGVLDAFWESKGYVTPEQFREFCSETVPLLRMKKRYWTRSETFFADIDIAHFGKADADGVTVYWRMTETASRPEATSFEETGTEHRVVATGESTAKLVTGTVNAIGSIQADLAHLTPRHRYTVTVFVQTGAGRDFSNHWDIWLFDTTVPLQIPATVHVAKALDQHTCNLLEAGGSVFLEIPPERVKTDAKIGFSSVFWNTAWTKGQAPHTLGLLCDPRHPAFDGFPTRPYTDWLWWDPLQGAAAMVLDHLPKGVKPIIQPIDTWFRSHRLALLLEARVGRGRILISSMDLSTGLEHRPAARQLRSSILGYLASGRFDPHQEMSLSDVAHLSKGA